MVTHCALSFNLSYQNSAFKNYSHLFIYLFCGMCMFMQLHACVLCISQRTLMVSLSPACGSCRLNLGYQAL